MRIIGYRKLWYAIALALILPGVVMLAVAGLNLGIDFTGGNVMQMSFTQEVGIEDLRTAVAGHVVQSPSVQASEGNVFIVKTEAMTEAQSAAMLADLQSKFGEVTLDSNEAIGPVVGKELSRNAIISLVLAMLLMLVYIAFRFKFNFAVAAVFALLTDVLVTMSFVALLRIEVDSSFIAAILTIVGYSINNTIVIFDRIRENSKNMNKVNLEDQINTSVKQTLTRSINTVIAILILLLALFIFGGETTKDFILILIIGTLEGLFSSLCLAGSFLYDFSSLKDKSKKAKLAK